MEQLKQMLKIEGHPVPCSHPTPSRGLPLSPLTMWKGRHHHNEKTQEEGSRQEAGICLSSCVCRDTEFLKELVLEHIFIVHVQC